MSRVLDLLDEPITPRDAVIARLRELAARPPMPDPRQTPFYVPHVGRREMGDLTKGLIILAAIIGMWVLAAMGGGVMRPRDDEGRLLPPAHKRLDDVERLEQVAVFKLSEDGRLTFLPLKRKLTIARRAIDHVVDGAAPPEAWFKKSDNTALAEGWRAACDAVMAART